MLSVHISCMLPVSRISSKSNRKQYIAAAQNVPTKNKTNTIKVPALNCTAGYTICSVYAVQQCLININAILCYLQDVCLGRRRPDDAGERLRREVRPGS